MGKATPLLRGVSTVRQHEGKVGTVVRQYESETSIGFCSTSSEFVPPDKPGPAAVTHPSKEIPIGTLRNIYRQANWKWEDR